MHLHRSGRRNKGGSIWPGLLLAGAILVVTIDAIIKIGWLALAPFGFAAIIVSSLLLLTHAVHEVPIVWGSAPVRAQDRTGQ